MGFFNQEAANVLQFLTLPAEILGLSLAFIEFRYPRVARKANIEYRRLLELGQRRNPLSISAFRDQWRHGILKEASKTDERYSLFYSRVSLIAGLIFVISMTGLIGYAIALNFIGERSNELILSALVLILLITIGGPIVILKFLPGRPLGGIGLLLASAGVTGEGYQMAAYMVESANPLGYIALGATLVLFIGFLIMAVDWVRRDNIKFQP